MRSNRFSMMKVASDLYMIKQPNIWSYRWFLPMAKHIKNEAIYVIDFINKNI
jgi:hypothetical protein